MERKRNAAVLAITAIIALVAVFLVWNTLRLNREPPVGDAEEILRRLTAPEGAGTPPDPEVLNRLSTKASDNALIDGDVPKRLSAPQ